MTGGYKVSDAVPLGGERWAQRDGYLAGHEALATADLTLATSDIELIAGVTRRF